jgi:hypothetical protein
MGKKIALFLLRMAGLFMAALATLFFAGFSSYAFSSGRLLPGVCDFGLCLSSLAFVVYLLVYPELKGLR